MSINILYREQITYGGNKTNLVLVKTIQIHDQPGAPGHQHYFPPGSANALPGLVDKNKKLKTLPVIRFLRKL